MDVFERLFYAAGHHQQHAQLTIAAGHAGAIPRLLVDLQGELLALHWSDIGFGKGTVHVARYLAYHHSSEGARHQYREAEPKTANSRQTIPLPDVAIRAFQAHRHEAGLPALRFHDLRHSDATILNSMGVNSKIVQERLGHSTISIALGVYVHVTLIDATQSKAEMS